MLFIIIVMYHVRFLLIDTPNLFPLPPIPHSVGTFCVKECGLVPTSSMITCLIWTSRWTDYRIVVMTSWRSFLWRSSKPTCSSPSTLPSRMKGRHVWPVLLEILDNLGISGGKKFEKTQGIKKSIVDEHTVTHSFLFYCFFSPTNFTVFVIPTQPSPNPNPKSCQDSSLRPQHHPDRAQASRDERGVP